MERLAPFDWHQWRQADHDALRFLSMHSAKGLEFPCVAIGGLGELKKAEAIEDDVRLTYVAITRATREAFITYSNMSELVGRLVAALAGQVRHRTDAGVHGRSTGGDQAAQNSGAGVRVERRQAPIDPAQLNRECSPRRRVRRAHHHPANRCARRTLRFRG